jgi:hypothetical protein
MMKIAALGALLAAPFYQGCAGTFENKASTKASMESYYSKANQDILRSSHIASKKHPDEAMARVIDGYFGDGNGIIEGKEIMRWLADAKSRGIPLVGDEPSDSLDYSLKIRTAINMQEGLRDKSNYMVSVHNHPTPLYPEVSYIRFSDAIRRWYVRLADEKK